jgi:glyoxylase-like metal-dependent hydrolase (beta-lactamase superfamily II)
MFDGDSRQYWQTILSNDFHFRPRKPTRFLQGEETISLGTVTVEVISTPGHTPGHLSFFFREPEVLFLGDYDLTRFGPWYGDVYSSIQETISSLERLRNISAQVWLTSHETGIFEQEPGKFWDQYLNVITERENKLLKLLDEPQTFEDIVGAWIIYGKPREPKEFFESGERAHMKKHLEKLVNQSVVATEGGKYYKI